MVRWLFLLLIPMPVGLVAQENAEEYSRQRWLNFILGRPISEKWYFEYDFEAAKQVSGGQPWRYLYGTGLAEYYPNDYLDLTGELVTGFTQQNEVENSFEATVRLGLRFHLISQIFSSPYITKIRPERLSGKRFNIANLLRIERRQFWYSGDLPSAEDTRFRNRIETKLALSKANLAADGAWSLLADIEWFVLLGDDEAPERFATKRRIRIGVGYRHSYQWRFDVLAMTDKGRDTLEGDTDIESRMIDVRIKAFF